MSPAPARPRLARRLGPIGLAALLLALPAAGQQADPDREFLLEAAKKLRSFATYSFKAGYPLRAREVYREILAEYDRDDEVVRKALGFLRVGTSWQLRPGFQYPDRETPDAAIAKRLQDRWKKLAADLGAGHRDLAQKLEEAGVAERAKYHWDRALRFLPGDPAAGTARGMRSFEGYFGSERDVAILRRSRLMDREIEKQLKKDYPVRRQPDRKHPILDKAGMTYTAVQSDNYVIYGDWEPETLERAARHAERALAFCKVAFDGYEGYPGRPQFQAYAYFKSKEDWDKVVRSQVTDRNTLDFLIRYVSSTRFGSPKDGLVVTAADQEVLVDDRTVRGVVQDYAGFRCDAMQEGIGHAVVGMFFGRNLTFLVAQEQRQRTVAGDQKQKILLPDLAAWEEEARERAWAAEGTPVAQLPLITADRFPDDGRIMSWSFCDYMLRRDPVELRAFDRTRSAKTQTQVAERYAKAVAGGDVQELEDSWRRFWREDTPLLRAVKSKVTPLEATSKAAAAWLQAFNAERKRLRKDEVGWSADYASDCKQHADYLAGNGSERGPAKEHTQVVAKGGSNKGRAFAQLALVSTKGRDPKKVLAAWLDWPGYRDALLNPNLDTIGLYVERDIAVFDVTRGQVARSSTSVFSYPNNTERGERAVPHQVAVKDLGPEVEGLLKSHGKQKIKTLGYPITMHFFRALPPKPEAIRCVLKRNDKDPVEGLIHLAHNGVIRRTAAPGLVTFYPLEPLKKGSVYTAEWTWEGQPPNKVTFETR